MSIFKKTNSHTTCLAPKCHQASPAHNTSVFNMNTAAEKAHPSSENVEVHSPLRVHVEMLLLDPTKTHFHAHASSFLDIFQFCRLQNCNQVGARCRRAAALCMHVSRFTKLFDAILACSFNGVPSAQLCAAQLALQKVKFHENSAKNGPKNDTKMDLAGRVLVQFRIFLQILRALDESFKGGDLHFRWN